MNKQRNVSTINANKETKVFFISISMVFGTVYKDPSILLATPLLILTNVRCVPTGRAARRTVWASWTSVPLKRDAKRILGSLHTVVFGLAYSPPKLG